jgi:hypothetical protein
MPALLTRTSKTAFLPFDRSDDLGPCGLVCDVEVHVADRQALAAQLLGGVGAVVVADVGDDHAGAGRRERLGICGAQIITDLAAGKRAGATTRVLAEGYGISGSTVKRILKGS